MPTPPTLDITYTSTVTPEQIDELGHMNVRWYGHNAVAATNELSRRLGVADARLTSMYTRHHHEQLEGNELQVSSAVLGSGVLEGGVLDGGVGGSDRLRFYHELRNRADGDLAATFVHELDHPGVESPPVELPEYARPRSLVLDTDGLTMAPTLDDVRSRDLAVRLERQVTTEDAGGAAVVPPWLANNLIWSGERPGGEEDWIRTGPNGERFAFATMESRLWVGRLPSVGTRIQSFGAVVFIAEKITRSLNWAYDLDSGDALAVFEVVNLAFDLSSRRSMAIPPEMREREQARLHPDLDVTR